MSCEGIVMDNSEEFNSLSDENDEVDNSDIELLASTSTQTSNLN
ncbi:25126_t:CDS:1, partial [Racocetra persica]